MKCLKHFSDIVTCYFYDKKEKYRIINSVSLPHVQHKVMTIKCQNDFQSLFSGWTQRKHINQCWRGDEMTVTVLGHSKVGHSQTGIRQERITTGLQTMVVALHTHREERPGWDNQRFYVPTFTSFCVQNGHNALIYIWN